MTKSTPASLSFKGQVTKYTNVKRSIFKFFVVTCVKMKWKFMLLTHNLTPGSETKQILLRLTPDDFTRQLGLSS